MRSAGYAEALTAWLRLQNRYDFDGRVDKKLIKITKF